MTWPVAMIPFTNMAPYRALGAPETCRFVPLVPSASIHALEKKEVIAAAVPVGGLMRLGERVEPVGKYGIAAKGASMSVHLFSNSGFERMDGSKTVRLTSESASSVRLLYLLLGYTHGFDRLPKTTRNYSEADGELLIGDKALTARYHEEKKSRMTIVTDLAEKWYEMHHLPFVFARWVVRKDAPEPAKAAVRNWLERFREQEAKLVKKAVSTAAKRMDLPDSLIERYFKAIRRSLEDEDLAGQKKFISEFKKYEKKPLFAPAG